jgi:hypothetical protein
VQITTPAANQFLVYAGNRWENTALDISLDTSPTLGGNLAGAGFNISNVGNITATGNVTGGNILTAGIVSATGNVSGNYFIGNGSQLTGISSGIQSSIANGTSNVSIATANGNATITANAVTYTFGTNSTLTLPGGSQISPLGGNLDIIAGTGAYVNLTTSDESSRMGVDNGGGYVTTAGGTWDFDTTGNLTAPGNISAVGNVTAGNLSVTGNITGNTAGFAIGYLNIPQVSLAANVTTALADSGKHYYSVSASNLALTIANNTSVSWPIGTAISIVNANTGNILINQGTGVSLYLAGNATAGNRVLSTFGMATIMNTAANVWFINGTGVS